MNFSKGPSIETVQRIKIQKLKKEEEALKILLKKYQDGLYALQVEELTIKHQLGKEKIAESDAQNNVAPEDCDMYNLDLLLLEDSSSSLREKRDSMDKHHINMTSLNLDATPLIQRMLNDSMAYEEEEDEI